MSESRRAVTSILTSRITRRSLVAGAAVSLGAAGLASSAVLGQDKAPVVEPQTGTGPATPNVLSSTPVPAEVSQYANDWPVAQGNLQATRAASKSPINASNIDKLKVAWTAQITASGGFGGITATPVIIDGTVYYQDMQSNVFAMDAATGKEIWRRDYNVGNNGPDGVAVAYGMVFAATGNTSTAFALDAKTGKEIWSAKLTNNDFESIDIVPAVYDNVVYISTNPNNTTYGNYRGGARGIVWALDAASGKTLWSFDTATDNLWGAPRINSGAGLWYPPSFDGAGNMYMGTGNAAPYPGNKQYPNGSSRPGANDYADSLVSLSLATGGVNWSYNAKPHDLFDHDLQNSPILAEVSLNGTDKTLIAVGSGKTGTVVAVDATNGSLLWNTAVGKHQNDDSQELPAGTTEVYPGTLGGVESPIAFGDGKIFVPYIDSPAYLTPEGAGEKPDNRPAPTGGFCAIDAVTGDIVWDNKVPAYVVAGATVVNDVVFSGSFDAMLRAYDLKTGKTVWEWQAPAGMNAPMGVAGDLIVFAAGAPILIAPPAHGTPAPTPTPKPSIVALKLGS
ncbi:MAG: PQQ-binding-like beta-propeller repeat protein [Thermomicrobiales bacterium]